jgi:bifunctional oligoribonuclease and PAP phosphatase NrnA
LFGSVLEFIDQHDSFLISGHVNPDGDCLGTEVALYHFLKTMGKQVEILNADARDPSFDFFDRHTPIGVHESGSPLPEHQVHCLVDCHQLSRLGSVGKAAADLEDVTRMVVDHHVGADCGDGEVLLWDLKAPSAGCLVYELYRRAGAPLSQAAAEGVFVSIVSDTGWFKYSNTTDEALAIAADLVAAGVKPHHIYHDLYQRNPPSILPVKGEGLAKIRFEACGRLAWVALDKEFMRKVETSEFNTDSLLDAMREVKGVEIVALMKEKVTGRVKISLRGSDSQDVDKIANKFGGGGHHKASGAEQPGPLAHVKKEILAACLEKLET